MLMIWHPFTLYLFLLVFTVIENYSITNDVHAPSFNFYSERNIKWRSILSITITPTNRNITDYVSVDVWDALGTNRQNVTRNVDKWQIDDSGMKRIFSGRNREGRELGNQEHDETLEEIEGSDAHAIELSMDNYHDFLNANEMAFIDMFAPWYVDCKSEDETFSQSWYLY